MQSRSPVKQKGGTSRAKQSPEFPGVSMYKDRHGKVRWRYRDGGVTINLGTDYGSPDFLRRYAAAVKGEKPVPEGTSTVASQAPAAGAPAITPGDHTLSELIDLWYKSAQFRQLTPTTSRNYSNVAENLRADYGNFAVEDLTRGSVLKIMQKKADRPEGANQDLRVLRLVLDRAVEVQGWVENNPARAVKKFAPKNKQGYHTWTEKEIEKFQERWPIGTLADLAMSTMLYTGAARVDAVKLGPKNLVEDDGVKRLRYARQKMETRGGVLVDIPVHPDLTARLDRLPEGAKTFLQTEAGRPRSAAGLGNSMRDWCDSAGLPHCTSHGLRKACARRLAEAGVTPHEIMAVTGHETLAEVERYTKKVARAGLADKAMDRV